MTINERFKYLRSDILGISQQQMAEQLNMKSGSTILRYEKNTFNFNDRIISDICRVFDVSEEWLRTGVEPMFVLKPTDHLEMLADEFKLDDMSKYIIEQFIHMSENDRSVLFDFVSNLYNAKQKFDNN